MLDHIIIKVSDLDKSIAFYQQALAPLGMEKGMFMPGWGCGFTHQGKPYFWIAQLQAGQSLGPCHVAFAAQSRNQVDLFHQAALAAGGTDHGAPGIRVHYHPNYYGAFVLDPDGHNLEAVRHLPE